MKPFTTVHEAVETASQLGITASTIAEAIGMSRQNFHNKLKAHGSTFTPVHVEKVNKHLSETFTAVHEKLTHLLELKPFTQVHEKKPLYNELADTSYILQKEHERLDKNDLGNKLKELDELLPF